MFYSEPDYDIISHSEASVIGINNGQLCCQVVAKAKLFKAVFCTKTFYVPASAPISGSITTQSTQLLYRNIRMSVGLLVFPSTSSDRLGVKTGSEKGNSGWNLEGRPEEGLWTGEVKRYRPKYECSYTSVFVMPEIASCQCCMAFHATHYVYTLSLRKKRANFGNLYLRQPWITFVKFCCEASEHVQKLCPCLILRVRSCYLALLKRDYHSNMQLYSLVDCWWLRKLCMVPLTKSRSSVAGESDVPWPSCTLACSKEFLQPNFSTLRY